MLVSGDGFSRALDGVASAALVSLFDEMDASGGNRCFDPFGLMADDGIDVAGSHNLSGSRNDMGEQRLTADLVQHLGLAGVEACAFACG